MPASTGATRWWPAVATACDHKVPVRVYRPPANLGCMVWAHGGSWISGSVQGWHHACADLAIRLGWTLVSVEYRLAPLDPHPAALVDVLTAVDWTSRHLIGPDEPQRLTVGGDSAGATVAAAAALHRRDKGRPLDAQVLAYPPLDPDCAADSYAGSRFPQRAELRRAWRLYAGSALALTAADPETRPYREAGYLNPLAAEDLRGTAPAVLAVGALDPVRDDVQAYADRLTAAGVPVHHRVFPDTEHAAFLQPGPCGAALRGWLADATRSATNTDNQAPTEWRNA